MRKVPVKYVFVFGGVLSGLGKGIVASSLGFLLKSRGYKVTIHKLDPYLNIDPGTMNPYQHGEVFVLDDGSETDLDLGHYERFIDESLSCMNTTSSGRVYWDVLERELDPPKKASNISPKPPTFSKPWNPSAPFWPKPA